MSVGTQEKMDQGDRPLTRADVEALLVEVGSSTRLNLRGRNLRGIDLAFLDLREAHFEEARLEEANLENAKLQGAYFEEANLENANLERAYLNEAHLGRGHFHKAYFYESHLERAFLEKAHLQMAYLGRANLAGAHLEGAHLEGAYLVGANLVGAHLEGAHLMEAHLEEANLEGADLAGANLMGAHLEGAYFQGKIGLGQALFSERDLKEAGFYIDTLTGRVVSGKGRSVSSETGSSVLVGSGESSLWLRLAEEPLTAHNLLLLLSVLTAVYTKCRLVEQGRFADVVEYAQSRDDRFVEEIPLVIRTLSKNSPTLIELILGSTTAAIAMKLFIDGVIQTPLRYRSMRLINERKALALKIQEQEAELVRQKEMQYIELEKQHNLLELEKQKIDVEKQILILQQQQLELQVLNREYAEKIARELVNVAQPSADETTKTVLAQSFVPHLLQLRNVRGLEIVESVSAEGQKTQEKGSSGEKKE